MSLAESSQDQPSCTVAVQVLADLANASRCGAFVGTFTSSLSKIVFASQLIERRRMLPFVSLGGCVEAVLGTDYTEGACRFNASCPSWTEDPEDGVCNSDAAD